MLGYNIGMRKVLLVAFIIITGISYAQDNFKEKFDEATGLMNLGNYKGALTIWLELEKGNPDNTNIQFSIGDCYMNSRFEKEKSIPYFKKAEKRVTDNYKKGNYKEVLAPIESIYYLGRAYHINYQFDLALEKYMEYKDVLFNKNEDYIKSVDRDIEITKNAMKSVRDSVNITVHKILSVNTEYADYRPVVNADESMMIFTSRREDSKGGKVDEEGKYFEDIYVSYNDNGNWTNPIHLSENINTRGHEATVYLSSSGDKLLIYKDLGDEMGGGIYESLLEGEEWSKPKLIESKLNSTEWETHASVSADGRMMAFTSDRKGGLGGRDIWFIKKLPNGSWGEPFNAGADINTEYDEECPYLHPDGKSIYFSSQGHNTIGGFDVYLSEIWGDGTFSEPKNLGYPVNTTGDDVFFTPTTNGKKAYFSSFRATGQGDLDIYVMDLNFIDEKTLTIYKGLAHDINGNVVKNLVITVFDEETDDLFGIYRPNAITGKFMFILRPGHTYEIEYELDGVIQTEQVTVEEGGGIKQVGRLIVSENDKLTINAADTKDIDIQEMARLKEASKLEVIEIDVKLNTDIEKNLKDSVNKDTQNKINDVLEDGGVVALNNVLFEFNSAELTSEAKRNIDFIYNYMKDRPNVNVTISGHTDGIGPEDYNQHLSDKRARSVRKYLEEKGIKASRLTSKGYGESQPVEPNKIDGEDNPEGRKKNRRVEFKVIK